MEKICMTEDIPEREARSYETPKGETIFITQRDGGFFAYQNICPQQVELEFLKINF
jgi:nitrite reductase/ring-hydroxylating ferredoxin subunit